MRLVKGESDDLWWCEELPAASGRIGSVLVRCSNPKRSEALVVEAPYDWQLIWPPSHLRQVVLAAALQQRAARAESAAAA